MRRILLLFEFERLKQSAAIFTAECLRSCNMAPLGWAAAASAPERENQWLAFPPQAHNWARWSPSRPAWHQCSGQVDQHHPSPPAWGAALGTRDRGANKGASNSPENGSSLCCLRVPGTNIRVTRSGGSVPFLLKAPLVPSLRRERCVSLSPADK